jgi:SAM-dependent methyltransferase
MAEDPVSDDVQDYYSRVLPFYEAELADRGDGPFWTWAAESASEGLVLEVGAGSGRATAFLVRAAPRVVAFDLAPEMIAAARERLADAPNVSLLVADMRDPPLRDRFGLVAAVDDPFVHLTEDEDRERAFASAAQRLVPGGRFILDMAWFPPEKREEAESAEGLVMERSAKEGLRVRETWRIDPETRIGTARFEYSRGGKKVGGSDFPARLWSVEELETRAAAAGLEISQLWGDFDRRPWDRETSERLIAEMRKRP